MKSGEVGFNDLFKQFRDSIMRVDPVYFCSKYMTVDGKPLALDGTGYKPFADIYRYIALKAIEPDSKPIVLVKGRQVGATTMAAALECYFSACGLFGTNGRPPMRMMHLFPTLSLAAAYTKDKLDAMIGQSVPVPGMMKNNGSLKSYMESKLDLSSPTNNNMHFKKFMYGNQVWIESTGLDGDRIRGRLLNLETELPTPDRGFIKLKDLKEGDKLFDDQGNVCKCTKLHPICESPESYKITFDDGTTVDACAEHLWLTYTKKCNNLKSNPTVKTTKEILETLMCGSEYNHSIPVPNFILNKKYSTKKTHRFIRSIEPIASVPMRCIVVDSPNHLFLITRSFIPTHNSTDANFYDECFPYDQYIKTNSGREKIGKLYEMFESGIDLPLVETYNESKDIFEYKKITKAWKRDKRDLVLVKCNFEIKCTPNHLFLTTDGWVEAEKLKPGTFVLSRNINYKNAGLISVKSVETIKEQEFVYDLEVEDNHNFIATSSRRSLNNGGVIVHNCQDMPDIAIGASTKVLAQSKYGMPGEGVQVYFGTPKTKGGSYWNMWQSSSQNYFHLRCEKCGKFFPLYHPSINWEEVWLYGLTVRCTECHHEQDKLEAQERGKWIPLNNPDQCDFVGYHINQLYIPHFTKETIEKAKPERSPINTERVYMNEVLGEFYDGEGGTITAQEIRDKCVEKGRKMVKYIFQDSGRRVYAGFDWGQRGALEQISGRGKKGSYSCAVIITVTGSIFNIEFATRLLRPDPEHKMSTVEEMFRRYNMKLAIGDIGDAYDLTHKLQRVYDEKFLASRSSHKVNGHIKYSNDEWPKTIVFEKDYYISELLGLLKDGRIKFPGGSYDRIEWLIDHCSSMDIKVTRDKSGEPLKKYVKGSGANDGLMALLNAYLAWKFDVTQGFTIKDPQHMKYELATEARPIQAVIGYIPGMFGGRR